MTDDELYQELVDPIRLPCGGVAYYDITSGCSHRCYHCMATVGSVGMPRECKSELDKYEKVLPALGSKVRWDFERGCEDDRSNVL